MKITNEEQNYIEIASNELLQPQFEVTKQYLASMKVQTKDGKPQLARIDNHKKMMKFIYILQ